MRQSLRLWIESAFASLLAEYARWPLIDESKTLILIPLARPHQTLAVVSLEVEGYPPWAAAVVRSSQPV